MKETAEQLERQILDLDAQRVAMLAAIAPIQKEVSDLQRELAKIERETNDARHKLNMARTAPRLSDHAVIRYLERKYGFSFEDIRKEIMTPTTIAAIDAGANAVKVNGSKFVVKDKTIVTCHG